MQNQPFSIFDASHDRDRSLGGREGNETAEHPAQRLRLLGTLFLLGFVVIAVRVAYLQAVIPEQLTAAWQEITITEEPIAARDGRILTRDGAVVAEDRTRYDLAIDYRWLEEPPNERWLRHEVTSRLSASERRDDNKRKQIEDQIHHEREQLWDNLAASTQQPKQQLLDQARKIQERIERMSAKVNARHQTRNSRTTVTPTTASEFFQQLYKELTTPPERFSNEHIVLKEELENHVLISNVPFEIVAKIESRPHDFPGVSINKDSSRDYPSEDLAAHVIGLRKPDSENEFITAGTSGVEKTFQHILSGKPGLSRTRSTRAEELDTATVQEPQDGQDLTLTLDSRLQQQTEQLLDEILTDADSDKEHSESSGPVSGCVVVMDVWTGDLLIAATSPRPSLTVLKQPTTEQWKSLLEDPSRPLFPRLTHMALPPGSVFKIVTAVAGLETGELDPAEIFYCRGYLNSPDGHRCAIFRQSGRGHMEIDLNGALGQSCNVFFYSLAQRMGPEPIIDWAHKFGFGTPTGIQLPGEEAGRVPSPFDRNRGSRWYPGSTSQLSIGQGELLATPLQVTQLMAAIANGGYRVQPRIALAGPDDENAKAEKIEGLSERTITLVRQGLEAVVAQPSGTGRQATIDALTVAGKTGTAEVANRPAHAWFAGYAPAESPRIAFTVVLEHGGSGGTEAAPIAKRVLMSLLDYGYLRPELDARFSAVSDE